MSQPFRLHGLGLIDRSRPLSFTFDARRYSGFAGDTLGLATESQEGQRLLEPVMRGGRRLAPPPELSRIRAHAAEELRCLPEQLRRLEPMPYPVTVSEPLRWLASACDQRRTAMDR